jgi:DUF4097 and DUF4098 domain-containing protein YvlB
MLTGAAGIFGISLGVAALSACAYVPNKQFRDEHTADAAITSIILNGGSGSVTITGSADGTIHVKRHVQYRDHKPGVTDTVAGDTLTLNTSCGRACSVDYDVTAPKGIKVAGRTGSGDVTLRDIATASIAVGSGNIRVRGASGDVSARSGSGDLDLADVAGAVACHTGSGNIRLAGVTGTTDAETDSGDVTATDLHGTRTSTHTGSGNVTLRLATTQDVTAETGSGDVRLTVPGGQSYRVGVSSSSGDKHVGVPSDASAAHQLKVHTGSGNITITQAG